MNAIKMLLMIPIFIFIIGCEGTDDDITLEPMNMGNFSEVISVGEDFDDFPSSRNVDTLEILDTSTEDIDRNEDGEVITERWVCTTSTVSVLDGNANFPLFDANSEVIFPGNLLQGKYLQENPPRPIVVKRAGGRIFYDLNNGNTQADVTVEEVDGGYIRTAMNEIISGSGDIVPSNFTLDIIEVQSKEQLALELGLKVSTLTAKVGTSFSYNSSTEVNSFLVKLNQKLYSMNYVLPTSMEEVFHESVTPEDLEVYIQPDNPATFISSVTYGRIFYMLIESTSSSQEMKAKLEASYGNFSNEVSGNVDVEAFNSLENVRIKVIAYGGSSNPDNNQGTFSIIGETDISAIAQKLEESTNIRAGLPLSYQVRSLERPDQIVGTRIATEFDVTTCELKGVLPPNGYLALVDLFEDGYGAMVDINGSKIAFFNKAGTEYAWYDSDFGEVLGQFNVNDSNGPLGATSFENIGAAVRFTDSKIYFFDESGLKCEIFNYNPNNVGNNIPTSPIGSFNQEGGNNRIYSVNNIFGDSGNFQFAGQGFSGATRIGASSIQFFGNPGDKWAKYSISGNGIWDDPMSIENLHPVSGDFGNHTFNKINGATRILFGGATHRYLYINEKGDQLLERVSTPDRIYNGPWVIN